MKSKNTYIIEETLIENYNKFYKLAYAYVQNESDAMDIVQNGAYKAILKSNSLKEPDYAVSWVYRIMINEAKDYLLKNKKVTEPLENINLSSNDKYSNIDLKKALIALDDTEKSIIILRYFEDFKLENISNILNINISTTKSKLYRALKKLENLLK